MTTDLLIRGARLRGRGSHHWDMEIVGDRITSIERAARTSPPATETIDAGGRMLMPGLIDCSVHLVLDAEPDIVEYVQRSTRADFDSAAARNAERTLLAGVTTVRDMGCCTFSVPRLRSHQRGADRGVSRIVASGHMITAPGGHVLEIARELNGLADAQVAIDEQIAGGADWIKLIATGGLLTPGTDPQRREMSSELIHAVGAAARQRGVPLAVHAYGDDVALEAIDAGARTIEHGSWLSPPVLRRMADAKVFLVPTLRAARALLDNEASASAHAVANAERAWEASLRSIPKALDAGVTIAAGSDAGTPFNGHGDNVQELELLVECGMSLNEAIDAATRHGARMLGLAGGLEVGSTADLLLVDGDPAEQFDRLRRPVGVIAAGVPVSRPAG